MGVVIHDWKGIFIHGLREGDFWIWLLLRRCPSGPYYNPQVGFRCPDFRGRFFWNYLSYFRSFISDTVSRLWPNPWLFRPWQTIYPYGLIFHHSLRTRASFLSSLYFLIDMVCLLSKIKKMGTTISFNKLKVEVLLNTVFSYNYYFLVFVGGPYMIFFLFFF